ncbi:MAG TPA: mechanosensitive ion channel family protein [Firmicutes bacterium]|nr:mechanosensitive ion channel family protein [Bacillota bacterium]
MEILNSFFENIDWDSVISTSIKVAVILAITVVAAAVLGSILRRIERRLVSRGVKEGEPLSESRKRAQTVMGLVRQSVIITLWVIAGLIILGQAGVQIGPILAGAGILGVALGFGAQSLVKDFLSGFFLIMENQVRVGDVARVNGTPGIVEQITFRVLVMRDLTGEVHIFPNGSITTLSNLTSEWSAYVFDLGVAYKENTDQVTEVIWQVIEGMQQDQEFGSYLIPEPEIFGVDAFGDSAVMIKGRLKTKPLRQWRVQREFLRRIKHAFDEAGIEIPFPHRSVYFGEASNPFAITKMEQPETAA